MKANELMVGDWVYNHRNWECPIVEIHKDSAVVVARHYGEEEFELSDLHPIPLTPEILGKNGFIHSFGDSDFYDYEKWEKKVDDKTIRVIKDHDGWFCRVDDNKLTRSMGIAPAVHTMQNIIRIGGIEKSIEL